MQASDSYTLLARATYQNDNVDWLIDVVGSGVDLHVSGILANFVQGGAVRVNNGADDVTLTLTGRASSTIFTSGDAPSVVVLGVRLTLGNDTFIDSPAFVLSGNDARIVTGAIQAVSAVDIVADTIAIRGSASFGERIVIGATGPVSGDIETRGRDDRIIVGGSVFGEIRTGSGNDTVDVAVIDMGALRLGKDGSVTLTNVTIADLVAADFLF